VKIVFFCRWGNLHFGYGKFLIFYIQHSYGFGTESLFKMGKGVWLAWQKPCLMMLFLVFWGRRSC
jgi:hypothetical protein